jgi:hypothetical protein
LRPVSGPRGLRPCHSGGCADIYVRVLPGMDDMSLWWYLLVAILSSCFLFLVVFVALRRCYPDLFMECCGAAKKQPVIPVAEVV